MEKPRTAIPYYQEINEFLASIPLDNRTKNPLFYCLRLDPNKHPVDSYKPPFRRAFYFIALLTNAGKTKVTYDNTSEDNLNSFLAFQSPGLVYSFYRHRSTHGYLIYFKPQCLSFFKPELEKEFAFFDILHTNFFKIGQSKFNELAPHFEEVFSAYERSTADHHEIACAKLLALLYQLKEFAAFNHWQERFTTPQQVLLKKYIQLININYIEKRTVEEYAALLSVTPKHLSQSVKSASGKNALSFISDRIITEAKSLIRYTDFDMAEIAFQLNFSDPANFGRVFKKHTGITPLEFKKPGAG
jgi:AraC family transcriptional regulator, transcriptional activator of pobA